MLWIALALALLVGTTLGLLGGGGSILTLPILRYALGMQAHEAIATSLLVVGLTSLAALVPHARRGNVRWRVGFIFGSAGMAGAYLGARAAHLLPDPVLLIGFAVMMLATALGMLKDTRETCSAPAPSTHAARASKVPKVLIEGFLVGVVTGLVGAGGGFLVVPALVLLGGLPVRAAIGTSLLVIAMKSSAGFFGFLEHTPIHWAVAVPISAAAVAGSVVGAALASRISPQLLRAGFGWFVLVTALFLLAQELPNTWGGTSSLLVSVSIAVVSAAALALGAAAFRLESTKH